MPASKSGIWANPRHGTMTGYQNYGCRCDLCRAKNAESHRRWAARNRSHTRAKARDYYARHPERRRAHTLRRYGITPEEFERLLSEQDGVCAICRSDEALEVDHDHRCCDGQKSCGKCVRGLLCHRCNSAMAFLDDAPERLERALQYLKAD